MISFFFKLLVLIAVLFFAGKYVYTHNSAVRQKTNALVSSALKSFFSDAVDKLVPTSPSPTMTKTP